MIDLSFQQAVMQILVHIQEEITFSTIDNDSQIAILYLINLIDNGVIIPYLLIRFIFSQLFSHVPVFRERANIHPSACASTGTKRIFMTDCIPHRSVSTHTQSGDGASLTVGNRLVMFVDILHQFRRNKSFIAERRVDRTIPVPTGLSVRTNEYDSFFIRNLGKIRFNINPCFSISTITVQQINSRTNHRFLS